MWIGVSGDNMQFKIVHIQNYMYSHLPNLFANSWLLRSYHRMSTGKKKPTCGKLQLVKFITILCVYLLGVFNQTLQLCLARSTDCYF